MSKALARSFGSNPSAGPAPAPTAAQTDVEDCEGDDFSQIVNEDGESKDMGQIAAEESDA